MWSIDAHNMGYVRHVDIKGHSESVTRRISFNKRSLAVAQYDNVTSLRCSGSPCMDDIEPQESTIFSQILILAAYKSGINMYPALL